MRNALAAAAAAALSALAAPAASAQGGGKAGPVVSPTRDVSVTYRASGGREAGEVRIIWSAAEDKMRVDTPGGAFIRDNRSKRDILLMAEQKMFVEGASGRDAGKGLAVAGPDDKATREGTDRVAGLDCAVWRIEAKKESPDDDAEVKRVCVTADGVLLRSVEEGDEPKTTVATKVEYGRPDPALFRVPEGYKPFDPKAFAPPQQQQQRSR